MNRRSMLTALGAGTAAIGLAGPAQLIAADDQNEKADHTEHTGHMAKCLQACSNCMNVCNMTAHYCFEKAAGGSPKLLAALHLTVDCQEFCGQSAKMIGRASPLLITACKACAEACEACAEECEKHKDDPQLSRCGKECRQCAASCRDMISHQQRRAAPAP